MAITVASKSIHLPDKMAESHDVFFLVYTTMTAASFGELKPHLPEHLQFIQELKNQGKVVMAGPFYTVEGSNTGDGMYVLRVDSLEEAQRLTEGDPMHKLGLRTPTVRPWVKDSN